MVSTGRITTEELAEELSHDSSVNYADIVAVLYALAVSIRRHLLSSQTVHLEGLGSMRVGVRSHMAETPEAVSPKLIYAYRVIFTPDKTFTPSGEEGPKGGRRGFYTKKLIRGIDSAKL